MVATMVAMSTSPAPIHDNTHVDPQGSHDRLAPQRANRRRLGSAAAIIAGLSVGVVAFAAPSGAATAKAGAVCTKVGVKTGRTKPLVCVKTSKGLRWAVAKSKAKDTAAKDTVAPDTAAHDTVAPAKASTAATTTKKPVAVKDTVAPDTTAPKK
jgi:hypothetical protein